MSTMMGLVPRRVGYDAGPVGSRALERPYRDRPASWRLVSSGGRIMADGTISWFAGVDWGSERHQVCLLDAAGQVVGERAFRHDGAGLAALCDWLVSVAGEPSRVAVAIEVPHGPVVDALLDRSFAVHAINPKQLERLRDRVSLAGAKDDRRDARVAAAGVRTDRPLFRRVLAGDPSVIELREWSRLAEELQQERVRLGNRVRQQLWRYSPQLLALSDDVTAEWVLALWSMAPTPAQAARLREATLARLLRQHRIRQLDAQAALGILRQSWAAGSVSGADASPRTGKLSKAPAPGLSSPASGSSHVGPQDIAIQRKLLSRALRTGPRFSVRARAGWRIILTQASNAAGGRA